MTIRNDSNKTVLIMPVHADRLEEALAFVNVNRHSTRPGGSTQYGFSPLSDKHKERLGFDVDGEWCASKDWYVLETIDGQIYDGRSWTSEPQPTLDNVRVLDIVEGRCFGQKDNEYSFTG